MLSELYNEFKQASIWQKIFLALILGGVIVLVLYHTNLIKISKATVVDCSNVSIFQTINVKVGDQFDPSKIHAKVCDHVTFTAIDDAGRWVAVGPHPTHSSYPGFDALHDLKKGETYSVVLNRAGNYSIHDHSHPQVAGSIVIDR